MAKGNGMINLEEEYIVEERDAKIEEQGNVDNNYAIIKAKIDSLILPYPEVTITTTGVDYDDRDDVQYKKSRNKPIWEEKGKLGEYYDNGRLFCGHVRIGTEEYFLTDKNSLDSKVFEYRGKRFRLIHVEDKNYTPNIVKQWRYPNKFPSVMLSRIVTMFNRKVTSVEVIIDKDKALFSKVSDRFLRQVLIKRKNTPELESIITTIQEKQDNICDLPVTDSFVIQGCAGSGKTMVLLHRLRRLLYNKYIDSNGYIYLIPSDDYREFTKNIADDFGINKDNIKLYQEYYQLICGKEKEEYANELVFAPEYLERVYSKEFVKQCYEQLLDGLVAQFSGMLNRCEAKIQSIYNYQQEKFQNNLEKTKVNAYIEISDLLGGIKGFINTDLSEDLNNIDEVVLDLRTTYAKAKAEYEEVIGHAQVFEIQDDDPRLLADEKLLKMAGEISQLEEEIKHCMRFMVSAKQERLKKLNSIYLQQRRSVIAKLIEADKKQYSEKAKHLGTVFGSLTYEQAEKNIDEVSNLVAKYHNTINECNASLENLEEYFNKNYADEILLWNEAYKWSTELLELKQELVDGLLPCVDVFKRSASLSVNLYNTFDKYYTEAESKTAFSESFKQFINKSNIQIQAQCNTALFNSFKKKIRHEFDIKICDIYKHYWYLSAYARYLTREFYYKKYKCVLVDEAQDLSLAEIELIHKLNTDRTRAAERPAMNLFGDVHQMITKHGIKSWEEITFIPKVFELQENFRNTNQIIDYCKINLPPMMEMKAVGVDMEEVNNYDTLQCALANVENSENKVFIVKDEYASKDLDQYFGTEHIHDTAIYTVKNVKGLEFKKVYVIDKDMSAQEKYIAYTRALAKLVVIKDVPFTINRDNNLIIQGEDE